MKRVEGIIGRYDTGAELSGGSAHVLRDLQARRLKAAEGQTG